MESISLGKDKLKKGIKEVKIASLIDDTPFNISVQRLPFYFVFTSFIFLHALLDWSHCLEDFPLILSFLPLVSQILTAFTFEDL